ncbi:hypothetical protein Tco_0798169 [Tanacetum coccineum]
MLWGIVTQTNVDHAELLWEEFTQGIQTFFSHKTSHKASLKDPKKKVIPLLIPYGRFSKEIQVVPKGESVEVFRMAIPDPMITEAIQQSSYYPKYLEMNTVLQEEGDDTDLKLAKKMSLEAHQEKGEGEGDDANMERAIKLSLDPAFLPQGQEPVGGVTIGGPVSETIPNCLKKELRISLSLLGVIKLLMIQQLDSLLNLKMTHQENSIMNLHQLRFKIRLESQTEDAAPKGQAGSDPEKAHEALAGPDPEPMQEDPGSNSGKAHLITDERVIEDNPESHSGSGLHEKSRMTLHQTVTSTPPVMVPFTDVSSTKPSSLVTPPQSTEVQQDKVALEEFDLKSALFKHMNKNKTANRNPANYHLYHALMEALIADEDAMDKEVAVKVKDHKRKHDSDDDEDDDDDEGPSAGSNQGRSAKRRRPESAASGSAQPPPKDDDQSSKKPRESDTSASKKHPTLTSTGWQITDIRDDVVNSSMPRSDTESEHSEQSTDDIPMQDEGHVSDLEDTDNAHIPKVSTTTWFKPIPEGERPATPEPEWTIPPNDFPEPENNWANTYATTYQVPAENKLQRKTYDIGSFIKWFCRRTGKKKLCKADLEGPAFNLVKAFHKNSVFLQYQMDESISCLSIKVTKSKKFALSISKLKAACYLDFGLEELVLSSVGESERDMKSVRPMHHSLAVILKKGILHQQHSEPSDREAVRSQMRILSVISVKVFEKYGYNYLREIILRRADYQEYKISKKDFKNLHPNDFEDLFLLNIQEKLNHLPKTDKTSLHTAVNMWIRNLVIRNRVGDLQLGIESYQTKINLERPNWDAADYYFKEDYTIVPKPRAVVYRDRNDQRKLMRLNELHKFSDGTLTRVMEKLDHMVKDFHLYEYNKGMETRKWSEDDKRRSKDFITAIEKRLQIRRIFRSLESFVGGRIRDIDYRLINRGGKTT